MPDKKTTRRQTFDEEPTREVRALLLRATLQFVQTVKNCTGVHRIALIGSLTTPKVQPKDTDLLITIAHPMDLEKLALAGRRLKGHMPSNNLGADIFLADVDGSFLGRICNYRECRPRVACRARHCRGHAHLNDDLDVITLNSDLIAHPPVSCGPGSSATRVSQLTSKCCCSRASKMTRGQLKAR